MVNAWGDESHCKTQTSEVFLRLRVLRSSRQTSEVSGIVYDWDRRKILTNQELLTRITINPAMAFGKPTIRGLRYSVEWLLETLSSGMSTEEILADYEDLEQADIQAVLLYTA